MTHPEDAIDYLNDNDLGIIAFDLNGKEVSITDNLERIDHIILQENLSITDIENLGTAWGDFARLGDIGMGTTGLYTLVSYEYPNPPKFAFIASLEALKRMTRGLA